MQPNHPDLWLHLLAVPHSDNHKYDRGHVVVIGGAQMTGAACLAAEAAMRIGAGLCTILCPPSAMHVYQCFRPYLIIEPVNNWAVLLRNLEDTRRNVIVIGPGLADIEADILRGMIKEVLALKRLVVLDASALTIFKGRSDELFYYTHQQVVMTPHAGEFAAIFPDVDLDNKGSILRAVERTQGTVLLKGAVTKIACADGRIIMNDHASPYLATAGSGDVLSGMIAGLMGQGMDPFHAASAATWIHGEAGIRLGAGMVSGDIAAEIPDILREVFVNYA